MIDWNIAGLIIAFIFSILGLARWFFTQFASLKTFISDQSEKILNKLEYHERHDDQRFGEMANQFTNVRNSIWEVRVQQAANPIQKKEVTA